jgi:hypothetical protein
MLVATMAQAAILILPARRTPNAFVREASNYEISSRILVQRCVSFRQTVRAI